MTDAARFIKTLFCKELRDSGEDIDMVKLIATVCLIIMVCLVILSLFRVYNTIMTNVLSQESGEEEVLKTERQSSMENDRGERIKRKINILSERMKEREEMYVRCMAELDIWRDTAVECIKRRSDENGI